MENKTAKLFGKEDYFTCGVCFNLFDEHDRKPMVWPCGHTVCFECTEDLFARNQDTCPECRQESNKSNIIENFSLMRMAKMAQNIHEDLYESMRCAQMANDQTLAINEQTRQQMADFAAAKGICENELLNEKKRYSSLEQQFLTEVEMAKQRELHMKQETEEMIRRLQGESEERESELEKRRDELQVELSRIADELQVQINANKINKERAFEEALQAQTLQKELHEKREEADRRMEGLQRENEALQQKFDGQRKSWESQFNSKDEEIQMAKAEVSQLREEVRQLRGELA
eukprot:Rmarinus@m.23724